MPGKTLSLSLSLYDDSVEIRKRISLGLYGLLYSVARSEENRGRFSIPREKKVGREEFSRLIEND